MRIKVIYPSEMSAAYGEHELVRRAYYFALTLETAYLYGRPQVHFLLRHGTHTRSKLNNALWWAASNGYVELVRLLVQRDVDISLALYVAARCGHLEVVRLLAGEDTDLQEALCWAAGGRKVDVMQFLIQKGANVHAALVTAAGGGYLEGVKLLVQAGADIHVENDTLVQVAAEYGHLEVVQFLVGLGADIRAGEYDAHTEVIHFLMQAESFGI